MKKIVPIAILTFVLAIGAFVGFAQAGTSSLTGWAWSSNIGWVSFNSANPGAGGGSYSVTISTSTANGSDGKLLGHAWSPNVGWISFNSAEIGTPPSDNTGYPAGSFAKIDMSTGSVTGWARALTAIPDATDGWDGWIHLSGTNHLTNTTLTGNTVSSQGVSYNKTSGSISGFAWGSDVVGWLNFYNVASSAAGAVPPSGGSCTIIDVSKTAPNTLQISTTMTQSSPSVFYDLKMSTDGGITYGPVINFTSDIPPMPKVFTHSLTLTQGSVYTYQIFVRNTTTKCGSSVPYTEPVIPATSGLRLLIATPTTDLSSLSTNYDDTSSSYKVLNIRPGDNFQLKWNIDPSLTAMGYNSFVGRVNPITGPSGSWGGLSSGLKGSMSTTGIPSGTYEFILTISGPSLQSKTSRATLKIVSSSIREK